jgi:hypothetical protein
MTTSATIIPEDYEPPRRRSDVRQYQPRHVTTTGTPPSSTIPFFRQKKNHNLPVGDATNTRNARWYITRLRDEQARWMGTTTDGDETPPPPPPPPLPPLPLHNHQYLHLHNIDASTRVDRHHHHYHWHNIYTSTRVSRCPHPIPTTPRYNHGHTTILDHPRRVDPYFHRQHVNVSTCVYHPLSTLPLQLEDERSARCIVSSHRYVLIYSFFISKS